MPDQKNMGQDPSREDEKRKDQQQQQNKPGEQPGQQRDKSDQDRQR